MTPLAGKSYTNLFSHYRPVGDPAWFEKENPPGTPSPLMHIGECSLEVSSDGSSAPSCSDVDVSSAMPFISPKLETITDENGLFDHWVAAMKRGGKLTEI